MKLKCTALMLVVTCFALVLLSAQTSRAQNSPQRIEIVAKRFNFTPSDITVKKGVPAIFVLSSNDVDHSLKIKELNVNVAAKKGSTKEVTFTPTQTGTFEGRCGTFCGSGHGSMKLTLHVTE
jgi:cytochrome c oxidase subunit II